MGQIPPAFYLWTYEVGKLYILSLEYRASQSQSLCQLVSFIGCGCFTSKDEERPIFDMKSVSGATWHVFSFCLFVSSQNSFKFQISFILDLHDYSLERLNTASVPSGATIFNLKRTCLSILPMINFPFWTFYTAPQLSLSWWQCVVCALSDQQSSVRCGCAERKFSSKIPTQALLLLA